MRARRTVKRVSRSARIVTPGRRDESAGRRQDRRYSDLSIAGVTIGLTTILQSAGSLHRRHVVARRSKDYNLARPTGPRNAISAGPLFAPLIAVQPVGYAYPP